MLLAKLNMDLLRNGTIVRNSVQDQLNCLRSLVFVFYGLPQVWFCFFLTKATQHNLNMTLDRMYSQWSIQIIVSVALSSTPLSCLLLHVGSDLWRACYSCRDQILWQLALEHTLFYPRQHGTACQNPDETLKLICLFFWSFILLLILIVNYLLTKQHAWQGLVFIIHFISISFLFSC